ncbi:unnamed protein product [Hyaloperonospora brassicae]|uniref:Uncharacterized protein n=1 Tax=Hyaloperonospora brassicae TaxID=162125 RepID=A0AAV0V5G1_HYABA|nr:unnamed protein product [Hyaloperonospora brassicae]
MTTRAAATEQQPPQQSASSAASTALVVKPTAVDRSLGARQSDLELHLLQTFAAFAGHRLAQSYRWLKHSSRVTRYVANATERVVVRAGLLTLAQLLFRQYVRLGHPVVQHVDDAMGKRVIDALVSVLMLTEPQQTRHDSGADVLTLEAAASKRVSDHEKSCHDDDTSGFEELVTGVKLTYAERFQALLRGEVPRMEQALVQAHRRAQVLVLEKEEEEEEARAQADKAAAREAEPPIVMELKDFVPLDEVVRLQDESKGQLQEAALETARLRAQLTDLVHEKQRLEQRLTDVHNYQESERGRLFQDMEEDLARTKLEASQKAHDLRALELVVEAMQERKRLKKRKSRSRKATTSQSNASEATLPSPQSERKAATHHQQQ